MNYRYDMTRFHMFSVGYKLGLWGVRQLPPDVLKTLKHPYLLMHCEGPGIAKDHVTPGAFLRARQTYGLLLESALLVVRHDPGHEELEDIQSSVIL